MKKIVLIKAFFVKNRMTAILISLLMFVSVFILCWVQGLYDYRMRYVNTLEEYVGDGDIFMQYQSWYDQERIKQIINDVKQLPGVESVLYNIVTYWTDGNNHDYIVYYYSEEIASRVNLNTDIEEYISGEKIECVACGGVASSGDILKLELLNDVESYTGEKKTLDFFVNGTTEDDFLYLLFDTSGGDGALGAMSLLDNSEVLFVTGQAFLDYISEEEQYYDINCYVIYEDSATEDEIETARSIIERHGEYQTISNIIDNSRDTEIKQINRIIIIPQVILGVVTFACCAMILLIMQTKMEEYLVYYLCGHSKKKIIMLCYGCLSLIMIIPCALNILIITFYGKISEIIGFSFGTVIYSSKQIIFTVVYLIIMLFVTAMIEFAMLAKMSPIEMYRRMTR